MYRYYRNNQLNVDVMEYDFDSITEFINYLDNAPINTDIFDPENLSSSAHENARADGKYIFYKTSSLQEAKDLCRYGYHEDFDRLVKFKLNLEKYTKMPNEKSRQYNFYVGYAPDVKAYLEGNPLSMLNKQNPKRKHIDIYYDISPSFIASPDQIFNRGVITLSLVEMLEKMGFSVKLNTFYMAENKNNDQVIYSKFTLKRAGERLNIQKAYFPMCHPSFPRRLVFRLLEGTPDINSSWTVRYGHTMNSDDIGKIIDLKEDDIVIYGHYEIGVYGDDIVDDANRMFDYINKSTSDAVKLGHVKRLEKINRRR